MTTLIPIIKESEKELGKLCDSFKRLCGEWHNWNCGYDEKPCHCSLEGNRNKVISFLSSSQLALLEGLKKEVEEKINKRCGMTCISCDMDEGYEDWCECSCHGSESSALSQVIQSLEESITYLKSKI